MTGERRVEQGLATVRERMRAACARAGRAPESVRLVAVSKRHPPQAMREAYALGQREFGENYVQELVHKAAALSDLPDLRLRLIGHLQRNKIKDVLRTGASVDTLDSLRLGEALAERAGLGGQVVDVLIQVNLGGETQKSGVAERELESLLAALQGLPALRLQGLMTIPPAELPPDALRAQFRRLRQLAISLRLPELSMGMSDDLELAIEEGATMVRVGTAVFGPRA
jgi:PLP dependent protein